MTAAAPAIPVNPEVLARVACPLCRQKLSCDGDGFACSICRRFYPLDNGILDLRPEQETIKSEEADWEKHWSAGNQVSFSQRFFSIYRKLVFARCVRFFVGRYLAKSGVLLEAGCGTAETSMRIDKRGGARTLVALDLVRHVLARCHPVMDVRVSGDIFRLPFQDASVDGIWNVGVMEHFTHTQIDAIMSEFHRVLRPGARVALLWPARFSIPQRMLRVIEWFINRNKSEKFRFHPDEISQLRSIRQGRDVLRRNRFRPVFIDPGFFSLMAFETLVGEK